MLTNYVFIISKQQAWSSIVYSLIPNVRQLEQSLSEFANIIDADEVLLFERATFLVVSHAQRKAHKDPHRFEKVSNIIKQFKLSCRYAIKAVADLNMGFTILPEIISLWFCVFLETVNWLLSSKAWKFGIHSLQLLLMFLHQIHTLWSLYQITRCVSTLNFSCIVYH